MKTQNKVNYEIKRMLNLFESKLGDVKTIINEESNIFELEEQEEKEFDYLKNLEKNLLDILQRDKGANAKMNSEWSSLSDENFQKIQKTATEKGKANPFKVGDRYALARFGTPEKQFMVFGKKGLKPNTLAAVLMSDPGNTGSYTDYIPVEISLPSMFERSKSLVSQRENLNAEQDDQLTKIIASKFTGAELTKKMPEGDETNNYEAVDLTTGKGIKTGQQYIDTSLLDPSSLDPIFKTPGKYYVWARMAAKEQKMATVSAVEAVLGKMGFTTNQNKLVGPDGSVDPTDPRIAEGETLSEWCSKNGNLCSEYKTFKEYMDKFGGDKLVIYPMDLDKAKKVVSSQNISARQARKAGRQMNVGLVDPRRCNGVITAIGTIIDQNYSDKDALEYLKTMGVETAGNIIGTMPLVTQLVNTCVDRKINLNRRSEDILKTLRTSSHKFSPFSAANQKAAAQQSGAPESPLSESTISHSIRTVINEHFKKENKDNLNTIIKKNLRRFL